MNLTLWLPTSARPGEASTAELIIKKLLFNIVYVSESPLLTLANGKSVEELGFIPGDVEFPFSHTEGLPCRGSLKTSLKAGT